MQDLAKRLLHTLERTKTREIENQTNTNLTPSTKDRVMGEFAFGINLKESFGKGVSGDRKNFRNNKTSFWSKHRYVRRQKSLEKPHGYAYLKSPVTVTKKSLETVKILKKGVIQI